MNTSSPAPLRVVLVGAGHRTLLYSSYADQAPDRLQVVGVVDPDPVRRRQAADRHAITAEHQWATLDDLPEAGLVADAAINGTLDALHVPTSTVLLRKGYEVLLEKPIATSSEELMRLDAVTRETGRTVQICHVLRYAPFYRAIRETLVSGRIGSILSIQMAENVAYDHMSVSFVRGKFGNSERLGSSILLAKCCHDLDLMAWMLSGTPPTRVTSTGHRSFFRPERAPEGAGTRCVTDCPIEPTCAYSAKRHYVDNGWWRFYAWEGIEDITLTPTREQQLESLADDNPHGRCVWHSDNDVVDHQAVTVEFADGAIGTLTLAGNSARPSRTIHIVGTKGELFGTLEEGSFTVREIRPTGPERSTDEVISAGVTDDMHGGGDLLLVADFVDVLRGGQPTLSTTTLEDSINGHLIGFAAELGRLEGRWVDVDELRSRSPEPADA